MKKILITGSNSYIGTSLESLLNQYTDSYYVDTMDLKKENWKEEDFSIYDVIFHVAGIAHVSNHSELKELYYQINRDLTIETALKAKQENVGQFIFMSSIIVYGDIRDGHIDNETIPQPNNYYGESKLQAEEGLLKLNSNKFKVVLLRPPMVYGEGSKGNYPKLARVVRFLPIFPDYDNRRSMIHIDNLTEFVRLIIDNADAGLFFPQNIEHVRTSELVRLIAEIRGKKVIFTKVFNPFMKRIGLRFRIFKKIFGNLYYDLNMSDYRVEYRVKDLRESIEATEKNGRHKGC